jgi:flagellar basal-body rod protein FlgB
MWVDRILASRTRQALELTAAYTEARHNVLAQNVANVDTPDYHAQRLDPATFQEALQTALAETQGNETQALELRGDAQVATDGQGRLVTAPVTEPAANVLFHDGTNARLETLTTEVAKNSLSHQLALNLLRTSYDRLMQAIRGRA